MEAVLRARPLLNARNFSVTPRPTRVWRVAECDHSVTYFHIATYPGGSPEVGIGVCDSTKPTERNRLCRSIRTTD